MRRECAVSYTPSVYRARANDRSQLKVEEPPEDSEYEDDEDDDISEPDEDTLAGQMAMMRGGKVKPSPVREGGDDEDEDEDESEYESSSDEEGPKRTRAINEDSESDSD